MLLLSGFGFCIVVAYAMISMEELSLYARRSAANLSATARKESSSALLQLSKRHLLTIAQGQAAVTDINLRNIPGKLDTLGLTYLKQLRTALPPSLSDLNNISYNRPDEPRGKCSYHYGNVTVQDSDMRNFCMLFDFMRNTYDTSEVIEAVTIAAPTGEFMRLPWTDVPEKYNLREQDWFRAAVQSKTAMWSMPHHAVGTGNLVVTCSKAVVDDNGKLLAIAAVDVNIKALMKVFIDPRYQDNATAFILDRDGYLIGSRGMSRKSDWKSAVLRQSILNSAEPGMIETGRKMIAGENGIAYLRDDAEKTHKLVAYAPISSVNWSFGIIIPEDKINKPVTDSAYLMNNELAIQSNFLQNDMRGRMRGFMTIAIIFLGGTMLVMLWLSNLIIQPLGRLIKETSEFDRGNTNPVINVNSDDEIGVLAHNFNKMLDTMKNCMRENQEITAAASKAENEINLAAKIQLAMLPGTLTAPDLPDDIELDAMITPSEKISGDFYDYTMITPDVLHFYIGDVSDKGITAAIFMTRVQTLLDAEALSSNSPAQIIRRVNDELRRKNESCMFAAVWYGVIDFKARKLCYCNAGFSCPLVSHHDGGFNLLRNTAPTTPVGAFSPEETAYSDQYLDIDNGFACVLYSDSIIETAGSSGEHFGVHRLAQSLNSMKNDKCAAILNAIQQGLNVFSDNIPPQDDRAMLMLRFNSQKNDDEK